MWFLEALFQCLLLYYVIVVYLLFLVASVLFWFVGVALLGLALFIALLDDLGVIQVTGHGVTEFVLECIFQAPEFVLECIFQALGA